MPAVANVALLTFPARALSPPERELVRVWLTLAGENATAYIADRRSDDPAHYRRVVVVDNGRRRPSYLIHQPNGMAIWVKTSVRRGGRVETFATLRAALNSVRHVLDDVTN